MENNDSVVVSENIKEENETAPENPENEMSKRARKRLAKKLKWENRKAGKRLKERQKRKERIAAAIEQNIKLGPSRKQLKASKMANSKCRTSVVIDMSFDELMSEKDLGKTIKQILRSYSLNRRSTSPMQLHITNFNGAAVKEMSKHDGYKNWDLNFHSTSYLDQFPKDKLVYLTSESDNVIEALDADKIYIIGGFVDHNAHKGLCYNLAVKQNVAHARLPISQYIQMRTRQVLTIDQVFEILLRVAEGKTWEEALVKVLPPRKGGVCVKQNNNSSTEEVESSQQQLSHSENDLGNDNSENLENMSTDQLNIEQKTDECKTISL